MRLWVDDLRRPPTGWTWAKTYDEAVEILARGEVTLASLDHDLGYVGVVETSSGIAVPGPGTVAGYDNEAPTGYDIVKWMAENEVWPQELMTHTASPVGSENMFFLIRQFGPYEFLQRFVNPANHTKGLRYFNEEN